MDCGHGGDLRAVHDDPRWHHRQHCYSPLADCLWGRPHKCAVGVDGLHPGTRGSHATHRFSVPAAWSEAPLPDGAGWFHDWFGLVWILLEPAHAHLLPCVARSDGGIYVAIGDHAALERIPTEQAYYRYGNTGYSHSAG